MILILFRVHLMFGALGDSILVSVFFSVLHISFMHLYLLLTSFQYGGAWYVWCALCFPLQVPCSFYGGVAVPAVRCVADKAVAVVFHVIWSPECNFLSKYWIKHWSSCWFQCCGCFFPLVVPDSSCVSNWGSRYAVSRLVAAAVGVWPGFDSGGDWSAQIYRFMYWVKYESNYCNLGNSLALFLFWLYGFYLSSS